MKKIANLGLYSLAFTIVAALIYAGLEQIYSLDEQPPSLVSSIFSCGVFVFLICNFILSIDFFKILISTNKNRTLFKNIIIYYSAICLIGVIGYCWYLFQQQLMSLLKTGVVVK